jgi:predicted nucleotidyltransferase
MPSTIEKLTKKGLIRPPAWLPDNILYETIMGSVAYGVSSDTSDYDVYGCCIPPRHIVFPHLNGEIFGFDMDVERFNQYQQHHIDCPDELGGKGRIYDVQIFNIVKYFALCMENNPNMIDSLFTPQDCVLHITQVGNMIREKRRMFLHMGCWHKFKGYAYSQLHKMSSKVPVGKRKDIREQFGFDVKFAYHVVRLLNECEQILTTGDLDLRQNREQLKAIRKGEMSEEDIRKWAAEKEHQLEAVYTANKCAIPYSPDRAKIKQLLLECLEHHYGSLDKCVVNQDANVMALRSIQEILDRLETRSINNKKPCFSVEKQGFFVLKIGAANVRKTSKKVLNTHSINSTFKG